MSEFAPLPPAVALDRLWTDRIRLLAAVEHATGPTADGWTPAEHLIHIVAWQRRLLTWFADDAGGRPVVRPEPGWTFDQLDALNARDYEASRGVSLQAARNAFEQAHTEIVALIGRLTADDLDDEHRYAWLGFPASQTVAGNSFAHYREHAEWLGG